MRAAIARHYGQPLQIEDVPTPKPTRGEVLVEVIACGVCHSDVHAVDGDWIPQSTLPLIPGHEVVGRIADIGNDVIGFEHGDLVGIPWLYSACGECSVCIAGMESICPSAEATGYTRPGGFAEFVVADPRFVARLPLGCDPISMAPILCAGVTSYRALRRSGAQSGEWVAIIGIGGLGHLAVQYARSMGLRVAAIDVDAAKLDLALRLGAEVAIDARDARDAAEVSPAFRSIGGVHAAIITATSRAAFESAPALVRPGGTIVYVGMPGGAGDIINTSVAAIVGGELNVRGSSVGTRDDLGAAVACAVDATVRSEVTEVPFDQVNEALDGLRQATTVGRTVLRIGH